MKLLLLFSAAFLFTSCVTVPTAVFEKKYDNEFNTTQQKELGESMITYTNGYFRKAIKFNETVVFETNKGPKSFNAGEVFSNESNTGRYENYYPANATISVYNSVSYDREFAIDIKSNEYIAGFNDGLGFLHTKLEKIPNFTYTTAPDKNLKSFKQEFIYNGISDNTAKFTYREYGNDFVRPAFTQETQYDLSKDKIIGFKGLRIEVIEATNTKISYKILTGFTE